MVQLKQIIFRDLGQNAADWVPNDSSDVNSIPAQATAVNTPGALA